MPTLNEIRSVLRSRPIDDQALRRLAQDLADDTVDRDREQAVDWINRLGARANPYLEMRLCSHDEETVDYLEDGFRTGSGDWICRRSYEHDFFTCDVCGDIEPDADSSPYRNHDRICGSCQNSSDYGWSDETSSYWRYGERPEDNQPDDDDEDDDPQGDPIPESSRHLVQYYSTDVLATLAGFRFLPDEPLPLNPLWMGVELEVEPREGHHSQPAAVHAAVQDFAILKSDSSIGSGGFEIVTVPMTLACHRKAWLPFFEGPAKLVRSWSTNGRCGHHVHLSRAALTDLQIGAMLVFVNALDNRQLITAVAGRGSCDYSVLSPKLVTDVKRGRTIHGDGLAFTDRNDGKTIELRIFRGNVAMAGFLKNLDFAHALCAFCAQAGLRGLTEAAFVKWLAHPANRRTYPWLARWAAHKGYIPHARPAPNGLTFETV